ncbi:hypothetical protein VCHA34P129_100033 [Vibrio chagasii]|nr:hypothetical protein VCHA34P129_100033 [Vibrio chagasii]CAH6907666.1 hypothetical protein VCHA52P455_100048 [Vibrio chagasii]
MKSFEVRKVVVIYIELYRFILNYNFKKTSSSNSFTSPKHDN